MLKVRKPITNGQLASFGVARCCHAATSERGRGWVGCLPLNYNARSEASEHAFARVAIPRQDPTTLTNALRRPFNKVPFRGMLRLRSAYSLTLVAFAAKTASRLRTCSDVARTILFLLVVGARPVLDNNLHLAILPLDNNYRKAPTSQFGKSGFLVYSLGVSLCSVPSSSTT